jgi:type II pantothenate kinase
MLQKFPLQGAVEAGFDLGASLLKIAVRDRERAIHYASFPIEDEPVVFERVADVTTLRCAGITGAGAGRAAGRLSNTSAVQIAEFDAWGHGARALLRHHGRSVAAPFLLVSVGTGTPILRVEERRVKHVGGSPLGGGCAMVLGASLAGSASFQELSTLAAQGDRRNVDLMLGDLYAPSDTPLPLEATAAHLGKIRRQIRPEDARRADLCDAIWGLVGDNIGLLCGAIAGRERIERVIVGGSTVQDNPSLRRSLGGMLKAHGLDLHFLEDGAHTGARGALEVLQSGAP